VDMKLEVIGIPVSNVDVAKAFYVDQVGLRPRPRHPACARDAGGTDDAARIAVFCGDRGRDAAR
jgi:catechol 2,3-dioxygenase-like lactoylglutathione lyase family enzyme